VKKITLVLSAILTFAALATDARSQISIYGGPNSNTYLGNLSSNPYDPNSTSNRYGVYGSPYSPNSVNNPYGQYGSPYSPYSANNPYATSPPRRYGSPSR
jgi:hypothetical protein